MKRFDPRSLLVIILTLVCVSLLPFKIVHFPSPLHLSVHQGSNYSSEEALGKYSSQTADDKPDPQDFSPHPPWFQLSGRLAWLGSHFLSDFDIKVASIGADPCSRKVHIGGSWRNSLLHLRAANLDLPSTATFPLPCPTTMDEISPSSSNGYLNSRIDLRRRKRAFEIIPTTTAPPSVVLRLRKDAMLYPRNVDPSTLRDEFEKAVIRNRRLREALAARKLRKGQKKKKKDIKVNPAG